jgi:small subunit ribosomal protein S2
MSNTSIPSLKDLMAVGAHFGHKRERSHPKAQQYIYVLREGIYIIDLQKTQEGLEKALDVVSDLAKQGKTILFVGTKPQAADLVKIAAEKAHMPYIVNHWPGGLLTNFETVAQNLKQLEANEAKLASDDAANLTKKEKLVISEKIRKTVEVLGGIRTMKNMPDALFVVDVIAEATAVAEAYRLGIPVIGICDTNANPEKIDFPIPANDDARKTIELITGLMADTITGNKAAPVVEAPKEEPKAEEVDEETKPVVSKIIRAKKTTTKETPDGN